MNVMNKRKTTEEWWNENDRRTDGKGTRWGWRESEGNRKPENCRGVKTQQHWALDLTPALLKMKRTQAGFNQWNHDASPLIQGCMRAYTPMHPWWPEVALSVNCERRSSPGKEAVCSPCMAPGVKGMFPSSSPADSKLEGARC